jgi:hypothetical protein
MNQAFFEEIYVDTDRVEEASLADPFAALLADDLTAVLERDVKNPGPSSLDRGSRKSRLVEVSDCFRTDGCSTGSHNSSPERHLGPSSLGSEAPVLVNHEPMPV